MLAVILFFVVFFLLVSLVVWRVPGEQKKLPGYDVNSPEYQRWKEAELAKRRARHEAYIKALKAKEEQNEKNW